MHAAAPPNPAQVRPHVLVGRCFGAPVGMRESSAATADHPRYRGDLYVVFERTSEDRWRIGEFVGQNVVLKVTKLLQL